MGGGCPAGRAPLPPRGAPPPLFLLGMGTQNDFCFFSQNEICDYNLLGLSSDVACRNNNGKT